MEAKYYTPELSEFHVGFEFETNYMEKDWVKKKLEFDDFGFYSSTWGVDSCPTEFRVKHLDREDMISLNYNHNAEDDSYHSKEKEDEKGSFVYRIKIFDDNIINICKLYLDLSKPIEIRISWIEIKNISELKKLMVQLNIK